MRACSGGKVKVVVEEELGEWELVGRSAREGRKKVLKAISGFSSFVFEKLAND